MHAPTSPACYTLARRPHQVTMLLPQVVALHVDPDHPANTQRISYTSATSLVTQQAAWHFWRAQAFAVLLPYAYVHGHAPTHPWPVVPHSSDLLQVGSCSFPMQLQLLHAYIHFKLATTSPTTQENPYPLASPYSRHRDTFGLLLAARPRDHLLIKSTRTFFQLPPYSMPRHAFSYYTHAHCLFAQPFTFGASPSWLPQYQLSMPWPVVVPIPPMLLMQQPYLSCHQGCHQLAINSQGEGEKRVGH